MERAKRRKFSSNGYSYLRMFVTEPPVTVVDVVEETVTKLPKEANGWMKSLCSVRNPRGVTLGDVCRAAGKLRFGHEKVTGKSLDRGKFGFVVVDQSIRGSLRDRMKPGNRLGWCEARERLEKEKGKEVEGAEDGEHGS